VECEIVTTEDEKLRQLLKYLLTAPNERAVGESASNVVAILGHISEALDRIAATLEKLADQR
jgi:hypothetical protein